MHLRRVTIPLLFLLGRHVEGGQPIHLPQIDGEWWQVAGDPDLGPLTSPRQQPVDFALWQAADGTWQLWSCIRHTKCGGHTRLFYRWEGKRLTDKGWTPMGIAMQADPKCGEARGGLQAPHVIRIEGVYHMFYGDWNSICLAKSKDGKTFTRVLDAAGKAGMFTEGRGANTRDAMVLPIGGLYYCYYTAFPNRRGAVYCRTSRDLRNWSESKIVAFGGSAGRGPGSAECPHVVYHKNCGYYYLFRTQRYGRGAQTSVYRSKDPLDFGVNDDQHLVCRLRVAAPEIILHEGRWYIASLLPSLKGIQIAGLKWVPGQALGNSLWVKPPPRGGSLFDFDDPKVRAGWRLVEGKIDPIFTTSTRHPFRPAYRHFIGTAESVRGGPDDPQVGVVESPVFTIDADRHILLVSGGSDKAKVHVALLEAATGKEIARLAGINSNTFRGIVVDTSKHRGKKARIRVVDRATEGWGHINFGGIFIGGGRIGGERDENQQP